jgi:DNA-binding MarR family transcriptional regulator
MKDSDALRLAHLTADLMMVIGRMKRSARHPDKELLHPGTEFAILDTIERHGCRTVPEVAAWRGVARQSVQAAVNKLIEAGLVEQRDNPNHKLSSLLALTNAGERHYGEVRDLMQARYLSGAAKLEPGDLEAAERVMAVIARTWTPGSTED